jgi:hypothetical protein
MGMDVLGKNPTSEAGEYFRSNVWCWRPLAEYCFEVAPDVAALCKHWGTNDGDGLDERNSLLLADALQREIDSGRCKRWGEVRQSELERLPNEACWLCEATGTRKAPPEREPAVPGEDEFLAIIAGPDWEIGAGDPATGMKCNVCNGEGYIRPSACNYPFAVENVQEFIVFLRGCGGFEIW